METISLRRFRDTIDTIHEPVQVMKRSQIGEARGYTILGYWTPYMQYGTEAVPLPTYAEWAKAHPGVAPTATIRVLDDQGIEVLEPVTLEIPAPDDEEDLFAEPRT